MARIERSIEIEASVDKVFNFAADWQNKFKLKWWPGIIDWKPTTEQTRGDGARFVFKTKALGLEYETEMETSNFLENEEFTYTSIRGMESKHQMIFTPVGSGTKVTDITEYKVPIPVIGGVLDALFFKRQWEANSKKAMQNLKRLLEG
jgi:uncharacterized membrane protein